MSMVMNRGFDVARLGGDTTRRVGGANASTTDAARANTESALLVYFMAQSTCPFSAPALAIAFLFGPSSHWKQ